MDPHLAVFDIRYIFNVTAVNVRKKELKTRFSRGAVIRVTLLLVVIPSLVANEERRRALLVLVLYTPPPSVIDSPLTRIFRL